MCTKYTAHSIVERHRIEVIYQMLQLRINFNFIINCSWRLEGNSETLFSLVPWKFRPMWPMFLSIVHSLDCRKDVQLRFGKLFSRSSQDIGSGTVSKRRSTPRKRNESETCSTSSTVTFWMKNDGVTIVLDAAHQDRMPWTKYLGCWPLWVMVHGSLWVFIHSLITPSLRTIAAYG